MAAQGVMQALWDKFAEGSDPTFRLVIRPCLNAMEKSAWCGVTEHSKAEFFRHGPLTDCKDDGVPHEGGYHVQPCMVEHFVKAFVAEKGTMWRGLAKKWFPPTSYCRTALSKNPAIECAKGVRRALPVRHHWLMAITLLADSSCQPLVTPCSNLLALSLHLLLLVSTC
jgi:hypothetical protein